MARDKQYQTIILEGLDINNCNTLTSGVCYLFNNCNFEDLYFTHYKGRKILLLTPKTRSSFKGISVDTIKQKVIFSNCKFKRCNFENMSYKLFKNCTFRDTSFPPGTSNKQRIVSVLDKDLIVYKKLLCFHNKKIKGDDTGKPTVIAKLIIKKGTKIVETVTSNKMRCEQAEVVGFYSTSNGKKLNITSANSWYKTSFVYITGENVTSKLDTNSCNVCSEGIHFFRTKKEAMKFYF